MARKELTLAERLQRFVRNWQERIHDDLKEKAAAQSFCKDLLECYDAHYNPGEIFEQIAAVIRKPTNNEIFDETEVKKHIGFIDMFLPDVCIWEMKAPKEDLAKHYPQMRKYWDDKQTRFMVLCNFREFWIYDTARVGGELEPQLKLPLEELPAQPRALAFIIGDEPHAELHSERITRKAASYVGRLVKQLIEAADEPEKIRPKVTKFAMESVFAMIAEDTGLIPPLVFTVALDKAQKSGDPAPVFVLFDDFDRENPEDRYNPGVPYINGPLFDSRVPRLHLAKQMLSDLYIAAHDFGWEAVRPEIFGSIFEQALNPHLRHELGAHFTAHADIMKVVGPTVVRPWQERISACKGYKDCERLIERMKHYHVLDPACGCGNFLYVAYRQMKRLEKALMNRWEELHNAGLKRIDRRPAPPGPYFSIHNLHGIDKQAWAAMLTRVVLWIAEHLANRELGLGESILPLKDISGNIIEADALFTDWFRPPDDGVSELAIVGNPPFLGAKRMRLELGDAEVEQLHVKYPKHRMADLVTYWYPNAIRTLRPGERAGFVSTNSIAQNESREVSLELVAANDGTIYDAWRSYKWPGEAAVHVSIINWIASKYFGTARLDGNEVDHISTRLTPGIELSEATSIPGNSGISFQGVIPGNKEFAMKPEVACVILEKDPASSAVIKRFLVGTDLNRNIDQRPELYIVDFEFMNFEDIHQYKGALEYVRRVIYPLRAAGLDRKSEELREKWWRMSAPRSQLRKAISGIEHYIAIARHAPHLFFSLVPSAVLPNSAVVVIAQESYFHYGILQSAVHEYWAWERGSTLKGDLRYTNTTIFETFPFPPLPDCGYDPRVVPDTPEAARVSSVAEELYAKRQAACRALNLGLTKLYNYIKGKTPLESLRTSDTGSAADHQALIKELQDLHEQLNNAVCACYGWPEETWRDENEVLKRLLELNLELTREEGMIR